MRVQSPVANELPALEWIGLFKRPLVPVFALFFAVLLSTLPINAQQVASKFLSFDSRHEQLNTSLGIAIGVDSVWAAATNDNRTHRSGVADNNDDQWKSLSVGPGQPALFRIEYCQLPAFASLQVDQIFSYRFILY
jgi:hypothetical protein